MRFLIDNMLSIKLAAELIRHGHDAVHVRDVGLGDQPDIRLLEFARREHRIILSADRDFGSLLAESRAQQPSMIYLRGEIGRDPASVAALIAANLPRFESLLEEGIILVIEPGRIRYRRLPLHE